VLTEYRLLPDVWTGLVVVGAAEPAGWPVEEMRMSDGLVGRLVEAVVVAGRLASVQVEMAAGVIAGVMAVGTVAGGEVEAGGTTVDPVVVSCGGRTVVVAKMMAATVVTARKIGIGRV